MPAQTQPLETWAIVHPSDYPPDGINDLLTVFPLPINPLTGRLATWRVMLNPINHTVLPIAEDRQYDVALHSNYTQFPTFQVGTITEADPSYYYGFYDTSGTT